MLRSHRVAVVAALTTATLAGTLALATPVAAQGAPSRPVPAAPAAPLTYTVKSGDHLYGIAKKLGVTLADLLSTNSLTLTSTIIPGQVLQVPAGATNPTAGAPAAPAPAPVTYTVKAGDHLFGIANKLGTKVADLLSTNSLTLTSTIVPGQVLHVPAGATNPTAGSPTAPPTPGAPAAPAAATGSYTVKAGDHLFGIARKHGITIEVLLELNGLQLTSVVHPGMALKVPAGSQLPTAPAVVAPSGQAAPPAAGSPVDTVVAYARAQLGKPYEFNSAGPDTFDCSGLTTAAYAQISIRLPHQSAMQATKGTAVDWTTQPIQAGDLVFMATSGNPAVISHVGIAISSTQWIHSPRPGDVVRLGYLPSASKIVAVRRFV